MNVIFLKRRISSFGSNMFVQMAFANMAQSSIKYSLTSYRHLQELTNIKTSCQKGIDIISIPNKHHGTMLEHCEIGVK